MTGKTLKSPTSVLLHSEFVVATYQINKDIIIIRLRVIMLNIGYVDELSKSS